MDGARIPRTPAALLAVLLATAAGCSVELRRPLLAWNFDRPILNERWTGSYQDPMPATRPPEAGTGAASRPEVAEAPETVEQPAALPAPPAAAVAAAAAPPVAPAPEPSSPRGAAARPLPLETASPPALPRSGVLPVMADAPPAPSGEAPPATATTTTTATATAPAVATPLPEVAEAAARLVGIRASFDQDSFLRHVLFVGNVTLEDAPESDVSRWIWGRFGVEGCPALAPGNLVFLGQGGEIRTAGVVDAVDPDGTATFVAVQGDEVQRLVVTPSRPRVRRDEASGRVLNSPFGRGRLTGESLLGVVRVVPDATGASYLAGAE